MLGPWKTKSKPNSKAVNKKKNAEIKAEVTEIDTKNYKENKGNKELVLRKNK